MKYDIVPFILSDDVKMYYYLGLQELYNKPAFLLDTLKQNITKRRLSISLQKR